MASFRGSKLLRYPDSGKLWLGARGLVFDLAKQLSSSVSRDPAPFLLENTCLMVESRVENHVASHPSLPPSQAAHSTHQLILLAQVSSYNGLSLPLTPPNPWPPCLHLLSPQIMLKAASRPESGAFSPLLSAEAPTTLRPRTPCFCPFAIRPESLITMKPLCMPTPMYPGV